MSSLRDLLFPPVQPPPDRTFVSAEESFTAELASCIEGGYFHAQFSLRWIASGPGLPANQLAWARQRLIREAEAVTTRVSVALIEKTEIDINARLQHLSWADLANVRNMSAGAGLTATAGDRTTAAEWENLQSRLALSRMNAELELERLRHLREEIFKRPEVARTYWLDRHPDAVADALSGRFEEIAEKLGSGPGPTTLTIANLLRDFLTNLPAQEKAALLDLVRRAFLAGGRQGLADQLPQELT